MCKLACSWGWGGILGPTADPFNPHCDSFSLPPKSKKTTTAYLSTFSFLWFSVRVAKNSSRWKRSAAGTKPAPLPPTKQLYCQVPQLTRNPPTTIHLPVKFKSQAMEETCRKSGFADWGQWDYLAWLNNYPTTGLPSTWRLPPGPLTMRPGFKQLHLSCFPETCLPTLGFESQPCQPFEPRETEPPAFTCYYNIIFCNAEDI